MERFLFNFLLLFYFSGVSFNIILVYLNNINEPKKMYQFKKNPIQIIFLIILTVLLSWASHALRDKLARLKNKLLRR